LDPRLINKSVIKPTRGLRVKLSVRLRGKLQYRLMLRLRHCFLIVMLVGLVGCSQPDFTDTNGDGLYLEDLQSKWLVMNYWATWCGPCIAEIPELNELAKEEAARLSLVGINYDQPTGEEAVRQVNKMKIEFPVLMGDPSEAFQISVPLVLPTTFIFAPGGELIATLTGPQTQDSIKAVLQSR
jgi:thiol-disulfide isomerase/thioredoxin